MDAIWRLVNREQREIKKKLSHTKRISNKLLFPRYTGPWHSAEPEVIMIAEPAKIVESKAVGPATPRQLLILARLYPERVSSFTRQRDRRTDMNSTMTLQDPVSGMGQRNEIIVEGFQHCR